MMDWAWTDAVDLAVFLKQTEEEYFRADVDKLANELWREMERDNYERMIAQNGA